MFGDRPSARPPWSSTLRKAVEDPKVVAVVLRVDSPGGSATASDLIWREMVRMKKPVIASMGDVAGSGGYYIAMGARQDHRRARHDHRLDRRDRRQAGHQGLYDKLGLTTEVVSRGKNSGSLSSDPAVHRDGAQGVDRGLDGDLQQFVNKAAEGRKMNHEKLEELAQGRVYTGGMAEGPA